MKFFRNLSTLSIALAISLLVHSATLTLRFVDPERFNRLFQDTPLEVILVNTKSSEKVVSPKAIAQTSLAGGGDFDAGRATTPLPNSALTSVGDSTEDMQRKLQTMQEQQMLMLAKVKEQLAALKPLDPKVASSNQEAQAQEIKRKQLMQLIAEIEKRINEQNSRPKKRYISPAVMAATYALYYDHLRRKIEDRGTQNFPEIAGKKLYGELTMVVTIDKLGQVVQTDIVESSGNSALDKRAKAIAVAAGPFGEFTAEMRREMDLLAIPTRFKFTRDETLETRDTKQVP